MADDVRGEDVELSMFDDNILYELIIHAEWSPQETEAIVRCIN